MKNNPANIETTLEVNDIENFEKACMFLSIGIIKKEHRFNVYYYVTVLSTSKELFQLGMRYEELKKVISTQEA